MIEPYAVTQLSQHVHEVPPFEMVGTGKDILWVHGAMQCALSWNRQKDDPLLHTFRNTFIDLPGHGEDSDTDILTLEQAADAIHHTITGLNLVRPLVVCWSFGGAFEQKYVQKYGDDDLAGIGFVDTMNSFDASDIIPSIDPQFLAITDKLSSPSVVEYKAAVQSFVEHMTFQPRRGQELDLAFGYNVRSSMNFNVLFTSEPFDVTHIRVPKMFFAGTHSFIAPAYQQTWAAACQSECIVFEESGHSPFYEETRKFNDLIFQFRNRVE